MVLAPIVLGALAAALLVLAFLWAMQDTPEPPTARREPPDPHRAEVEKFRRAVADWDGSRGMA